jgi:hypothetical protein
MAANPDVTWNFVVMHTSLFSTGSHSDPNGIYFNGEIGVYRPAMAPIFTSLGIDVVLSGHDHVYVRSHMMDGVNVSSDKVYDSNTVYQPDGTLYLCASSSTGTKFYNSYGDDYFIAYQNTVARKSAVKFSITDEAIVMQSYFLNDMTVFDSFTISKETAPDHVCELKAVSESAPSCGVEGKAAHYLCKCGKAYEDEAGNVEITDLASWGNLPALEHSFTIKATCTRPESCANCGLTQGESLGHQFAAATCTTAKTCQREGCGVVIGATLGHKAGEECFSDESGHWHVCKTCEDKVDVEGHVDIDENGKCDVCDYATSKKSDGKGCGSTVGVMATTPLLLAVGIVLTKKQRKKTKTK